MDRLLQKHKCTPPKLGRSGLKKFLKDEEKVVECIENVRLRKTQRG